MVLEGMLIAVEELVTAYGLSGAFVIAVLESFIFPIPTAVIIAPATTFGVDPFLITIVATIGSVLGAVIGYGLGKYLGRPVAGRLFKKKLQGVEKWFDKYGAWAVLIAAFTPIPFKVFTWASGIFELDMKKFLVASLIGRFVQFAIAAYVGSLFGPILLSWFGIAL